MIIFNITLVIFQASRNSDMYRYLGCVLRYIMKNNTQLSPCLYVYNLIWHIILKNREKSRTFYINKKFTNENYDMKNRYTTQRIIKGRQNIYIEEQHP